MFLDTIKRYIKRFNLPVGCSQGSMVLVLVLVLVPVPVWLAAKLVAVHHNPRATGFVNLDIDQSKTGQVKGHQSKILPALFCLNAKNLHFDVFLILKWAYGAKRA